MREWIKQHPEHTHTHRHAHAHAHAHTHTHTHTHIYIWDVNKPTMATLVASRQRIDAGKL